MKLKFTLILSIVICTNAFSQCIQADYPFSGNANDVSGNNLNANTLNGVTLTSDRFGNANSAYQFDGIDDRIDLLDDFDFPLRTWSLWFYADTILQTPNVIMDNDHNNIQFGQTEISLTEIGGIKNLALLIGANAIFIPVNEKEWYHVAAVRETFGASFYLNGCLIHTGLDTTNDHSIDGLFTPTLGASRLHNDFFYKGKLDDVKIFNCALTQPEISVLADSMCFTVSVNDITNKSETKVYPNPTSNSVLISVEQNTTFDLYNSLGQLIQTNTLTTGKTEINIQNRGIYFAIFKRDNIIIESRKIVRQ